MTRPVGRQIEGHKPSGDDAAEDRPAQLADGEDAHVLLGQTSGIQMNRLLSFCFYGKIRASSIPKRDKKSKGSA